MQLKRCGGWQLALQQFDQLQLASTSQDNVAIRALTELLKLTQLPLLPLTGQLKVDELIQQATAVGQQGLRRLGQPVFRLLAATANPPQPSGGCRQQAQRAGAAMEKIPQHQATTKQGRAHKGWLEPRFGGKRGDRHEMALTAPV